MAREDHQIRVRLPALLEERLRQNAEAANRSLNAEIVSLLEEALSSRRTTLEELERRMADLEAQGEELRRAAGLPPKASILTKDPERAE